MESATTLSQRLNGLMRRLKISRSKTIPVKRRDNEEAGRINNIQMSSTKPRIRTPRALASRIKASVKMVFSPRSTRADINRVKLGFFRQLFPAQFVNKSARPS